MDFNSIKFILMDVEGTTTSLSFVKDILFPYAEKNIIAFVKKIFDKEFESEELTKLEAILDKIKKDIALEKNITNEKVNIEDISNLLLDCIKKDLKYPPLKELQGYLWEYGYKNKDFTGHVYQDIPTSFENWINNGIKLGIYSSGSVLAQKLLFSYSDYGNLDKYISNNFDLAIGGKKEKTSYFKISESLKLPPNEILFLSDVLEELEAAFEAGFQVCQILRPEVKKQTKYTTSNNFLELNIKKLPYTVVFLEDRIKLIDQTKLPEKLEYIECFNYDELGLAIKELKVRGAPAIGIAAGFGIALHLKQKNFVTYEEFEKELVFISDFYKSTRPTAVNLFWVIDRINAKLKSVFKANLSIKELKNLVLKEAYDIALEDENMCNNIGKFGLELIPDNAVILTHCNTGGLATYGYGTAIGIIKEAHYNKKNISVFADETRPLLQGARLTTWELMQENIPVTLITDSMAGYFMSIGKIDLVIVGADRIAKNGDTANKIGTYSLAILAKEHHIPFYVAAPTSTIDINIESGKSITIEERNPNEITSFGNKKVAPENVVVANPAFDVTPAKYITAIITEKGIIKPNEVLKIKN